MAQIVFAYHAARVWSPERFQPNVFLCDEKEIPFAVLQDDGAGRLSADIGNRTLAALHLRWPVPSFGEVTLPTAPLLPRDTPYNLNVEIARRRIELIERFVERWSKDGYVPSSLLADKLNEARAALAAVSPEEDERVNARWGDLSLSISMVAGEDIALECARWQMERRRDRRGFDSFLLGCNFFRYPTEDKRYAQYFTALFNYATLPFYWASFEPEIGREQYEKVDVQAAYLQKKGIVMKGHPLMWFHTMPSYAPVSDIPAMKTMLRERIHRILDHYQGQIVLWDAINEIQHVHPYEDAGVPADLTRFVCDCVREFSPKATRVVNVDEPFGEYMARPQKGKMHPITYFEELQKQKVDFDVIGIQVYQGSGWTYTRDLFEMSRYIDRYEAFGKPVHLTELGVPSREGYDRKDYSWHDNGRIFPQGLRFLPSDAGFWHMPWSEQTQADWVEGFYSVLMGKPFVQGITWWDFSDDTSHFYTHSGLLNEQMEPKLAYHRLMALKQKYIGK